MEPVSDPPWPIVGLAEDDNRVHVAGSAVLTVVPQDLTVAFDFGRVDPAADLKGSVVLHYLLN